MSLIFTALIVFYTLSLLFCPIANLFTIMIICGMVLGFIWGFLTVYFEDENEDVKTFPYYTDIIEVEWEEDEEVKKAELEKVADSQIKKSKVEDLVTYKNNKLEIDMEELRRRLVEKDKSPYDLRKEIQKELLNKISAKVKKEIEKLIGENEKK